MREAAAMSATFLLLHLLLLNASLILGEKEKASREDEIQINTNVTLQSIEDNEEETGSDEVAQNSTIESQLSGITLEQIGGKFLDFGFVGSYGQKTLSEAMDELCYIVNYVFTAGGVFKKDLLKDVLAEWGGILCVKFVEISPSEIEEYEMGGLYFKEGTSSCCEFPALFGGIFQRSHTWHIIYLHPSCMTKNELIRGIGLVLGLENQIDRDDAESFVNFNNENAYAKIKPNLSISHTHDYEYFSVMHPPGLFLSKNGRLTITTKDIRHQGILGRARGVSFNDRKDLHDISVISSMYDDTCKEYDAFVQCSNGGILDKDCNCVCPEAYSGETCEIKEDKDHLETYLPECSKDIREAATIESPRDSSEKVPYDTWCVWRIFAPESLKVKLKFKSFELNTTEQCRDTFLEIREKGKPYGDMYCKRTLDKVEHLSENNELYLYMDVKNKISRGFQVDVCFVKSADETCKISAALRIQSNNVIILYVLATAMVILI